MSQQQCLPLPRRRKREPNDDENDTQLSGKVSIDDLANMDAMTYLAAVSREAHHLPEVFVSSPPSKPEGGDNDKKKKEEGEEQHKRQRSFVPIDGSAAATSYMLSSRMNMEGPPSPLHIPKSGRVWVERTCANFSSLRAYLDGCSAAGLGEERKFNVPAMKDGSGWHVFCLGRDEAMGNVGGYFDDDDDDDDDIEDAGEEEEGGGEKDSDMEENSQDNGDNTVNNDENKDATEMDTADQKNSNQEIPRKGHPPSVQLLCQMDQVMTRRVLTHHARFITEEGYKLTCARGAWLYGLLARLEKPLHRDEEATLTRILRECCKRRANLAVKDGKIWGGREELNMLNVIIAIIGVYFEQGGRMDDFLLGPKSSYR